MSKRLSGKVCVITGTGGGMGREAVITFAREGALVVGCDLQVGATKATVEAVRAAGGTMVSLQPCHLSEPADCRALVDLAMHTFGRIDVLFNNAALAYLIQGAIDALVKRAINSGDIRKDLDAFDLLRALVGVSHMASGPDCPRGCKDLTAEGRELSLECREL